MACARRTKIEHVKAIKADRLQQSRISSLRISNQSVPVTTLEELVVLESYDQVQTSVAVISEMRDCDIDHPNDVAPPGKERLLTHCQFLIETFRSVMKEVDDSVQEAIDKEISVLELLQIEGIHWYESRSDKPDEQIKMRDAIATGIFRVFIAVLSAANAD
ncbi:hypothetical protein LTR97_010035 [Elasticomyces elasticus]|uniref:Uncharacterized protein n=1 Tax=Elasticomyces elasticus TaxID=574655 RepID=A0AAN7W0D1_9PEZI|nr:hypothetical protein LTR97_010035 [Elasticomyces elasticus]